MHPLAFSKQDSFIMRRCLLLAQKGEGRASPNPLVGAVIASKGKIIGQGFHGKFGGAHAEVNAINDAKLRGHNVSGATLYVSLEPCSHSCAGKKTPPCVPLIIKSGVARVVAAAKDPNPKVCGRGISQLRKAGIPADVGLLATEAQELNAPFFKLMRTGKPFVCIKMAQSSNGFIAIRGKKRSWLSGKKFDSYSHLLRNRYDAIAVGINTVLADDPRLTCRIPGGRNPARIILDSSLCIPLSSKVLHNAKREKVIIATSGSHDRAKEKQLKKMGAIVLICGKNKVSLPLLQKKLPPLGIYSLLVEGGERVVRSFLQHKLADKLVLCISQKKIAGDEAVASPFFPLPAGLYNVSKRKMGKDTVIEGYFRF